LPTSKGPPSSLIQLRTAVWTGDTRDTMPNPEVALLIRAKKTPPEGGSSVQA
jgi:hypothetical protein